MKQYRAIFRGPGWYAHPEDIIEYGQARDSLEKALKDRPPRSEETHARHVGVQTRDVTEWVDMPKEEK